MIQSGKHTITSVALEKSLPRTTVSGIWAQRGKIQYALATVPGAEKSSRVRKPTEAKLEGLLYTYFKQMRERNAAISGPILCEKARQFARKLKLKGFTGSQGWLHNFKKRYNIVCLAICGEAQKVDKAEIKAWVNKNRALICSFKEDDIYNADETGLFFNMMPNRTLAIRGEKCHGGAHSKERLTILLCTNMTGTDKMKPLVIGKFILQHMLTH